MNAPVGSLPSNFHLASLVDRLVELKQAENTDAWEELLAKANVIQTPSPSHDHKPTPLVYRSQVSPEASDTFSTTQNVAIPMEWLLRRCQPVKWASSTGRQQSFDGEEA